MLGKITIPRFFGNFDEKEWNVIHNYNSKQSSKLFIPRNFKMPDTNSCHKLSALGYIFLPEEVRKKATERRNIPEKMKEMDAFNTMELERNTFIEKLNQKIEFYKVNLSDLKRTSKRVSKPVNPILINAELINNYPILPSLKKYQLKKANSPTMKKESTIFTFGQMKKNWHQLQIQIPPDAKNEDALTKHWILKSTTKKVDRNISQSVKSLKFKRSKSNCINFKDTYIKRKTRISDFLKPSIFQNNSELTLNKEVHLLLEQDKIDNNNRNKNNFKAEEENEETLQELTRYKVKNFVSKLSKSNSFYKKINLKQNLDFMSDFMKKNSDFRGLSVMLRKEIENTNKSRHKVKIL